MSVRKTKKQTWRLLPFFCRRHKRKTEMSETNEVFLPKKNCNLANVCF